MEQNPPSPFNTGRGGGKSSGGDNFVGEFRLSGSGQKFPLAKFRDVGSAVKMLCTAFCGSVVSGQGER